MKFLQGALLPIMMLVYVACAGSEERPKEFCENGTCRRICDWKKSYTLHSRTDCMRAKFGCQRYERMFGDFWGCGCLTPVYCDKKPG